MAFGGKAMKKLTWITGILICLAVLLCALGAVCGAVDQLATDENFYGGMSRAAVAKYLGVENDPQVSAQVTAYIGMDAAQQGEFAVQMAAFMAGETDAQPDVLNEKERQHMLDVRNLTRSAAGMSRTYMTVAAVLAIAAAWTSSRLKSGAKPKLIGVLAAVSVIMIVVAGVASRVTAGGFGDLFMQMHEAVFTNDLWLMDPATDILIRMMPQPLFEQALLNGANLALRMLLAVSVMLIAIEESVSRMIRRHAAKQEQ